MSSEQDKQVASPPETRDPTLFLLLWLGIPMLLMTLYALFGPR